MSDQCESRDHEDIQDWQPCPAGELQRMLSSRLRVHRLRRLAQVGGAVALVLVAVWLAIPLPGPQPASAARFRCSDVTPLADDYLAHRLEPELNERMEQHLLRCRGCRVLLDSHRHGGLSWFCDPATCTEPHCPHHSSAFAVSERSGPAEPDMAPWPMAEDLRQIQWPEPHLAFALPYPAR